MKMDSNKEKHIKVLNLSLDPHLLDPESVVTIRARLYGRKTGAYTSVVPTPAKRRVVLSDEAVVYGSGGINKIVRLINICLLVRKLVRSGEANVITSQDAYFLGLVGLYFARRYHLGLEIQILGLEKVTWFRTLLAKYVLRRASIVRVLSNSLFDRLNAEFKVPKEQMEVIPIYIPVEKLGLDIRTLDPAKQHQYNQLAEEYKKIYGQNFNFVTIARLVPIKKIEQQLQAIAVLKTNHPEVRLHIVGDGPMRPLLEATAKKLGVSEYVVFHGVKYDLELGVFYLQSDCFLLTSDYEGLGMVIVEAITAGLPVIMTDVGCAGDLIINEKSGLVVPVGDQDAITDAMRRVMEEKELKGQLAEGAFAAMKQLPPLEEILEQYYGLWKRAYENVL